MTRSSNNSIITPGTLEALASATGVDGKVEDIKGTAQGSLRIQTDVGVIHCTVDQFGDAYRGMVRLWPKVAAIREQQDKRRAVQAVAARKAAKAAKIEATKQAKAQAKADRDAKAKAAKTAKK